MPGGKPELDVKGLGCSKVEKDCEERVFVSNFLPLLCLGCSLTVCRDRARNEVSYQMMEDSIAVPRIVLDETREVWTYRSEQQWSGTPTEWSRRAGKGEGGKR